MKSCKHIVLAVSLSLPSTLMAQKANSDFVPFTPSYRVHSAPAKAEINLAVQPLNYGQCVTFQHHLPAVNFPHKQGKLFNHSSTHLVYHFNMPVVKPGNTSKILIAKNDPYSPYTYNMPIKKH